MNWFKKAYGDPLELNWDKIALELKVEFEENGDMERKPTASEIQYTLMQKYWNAADEVERFNI